MWHDLHAPVQPARAAGPLCRGRLLMLAPGHAMPLGSYEALRSVWRQQVAIQNCHLQRHVLSHDVVISRPQLQGRSRHA